MSLMASRAIKARGGTGSFNSNVRREMPKASNWEKRFDEILATSEILLASDDEVYLSAKAEKSIEAAGELLGKGVGAVVWKRGSKGASYYDVHGRVYCSAYEGAEVDPIAGRDCFGGIRRSLAAAGVDKTLICGRSFSCH